MFKKLVVLLALVSMFFVAGCSVNPSEVSDDYAKKFTAKVKYAKDDRTGLCFAMVATRKTGNTDSSGMGLTLVPCEAVEDLLVK